MQQGDSMRAQSLKMLALRLDRYIDDHYAEDSLKKASMKFNLVRPLREMDVVGIKEGRHGVGPVSGNYIVVAAKGIAIMSTRYNIGMKVVHPEPDLAVRQKPQVMEP